MTKLAFSDGAPKLRRQYELSEEKEAQLIAARGYDRLACEKRIGQPVIRIVVKDD